MPKKWTKNRIKIASGVPTSEERKLLMKHYVKKIEEMHETVNVCQEQVNKQSEKIKKYTREIRKAKRKLRDQFNRLLLRHKNCSCSCQCHEDLGACSEKALQSQTEAYKDWLAAKEDSILEINSDIYVFIVKLEEMVKNMPNQTRLLEISEALAVCKTDLNSVFPELDSPIQYMRKDVNDIKRVEGTMNDETVEDLFKRIVLKWETTFFDTETLKRSPESSESNDSVNVLLEQMKNLKFIDEAEVEREEVDCTECIMGSGKSKALTLIPVDDYSDYGNRNASNTSTATIYDGISFFNHKLDMTMVIGRGGYGLVVAVQDATTKKHYAVKMQCYRSTSSDEKEAYDKLKGVKGIPKFYAFWEEHKHFFFQLELVGMNLVDFVRNREEELSEEEAYTLAPKMIDILQSVHAKGIVHCDIKPANIAFGIGSKSSELYILDLGLAVSYLKPDGKHIEEQHRRRVGTSLYMSSNTHYSLHNTRRDDLESLVYTLMELMLVAMPWKSKRIPQTPGDHAVFSSMKDAIVVNNTLIECPELHDMLKMVRLMRFDETPNYKALKDVFKKIPKVTVKPEDGNKIIKRMLRNDEKLLLMRFIKGNEGEQEAQEVVGNVEEVEISSSIEC